MGIRLDLIKEDQRILLIPHLFTGDGADLEVKVLDRADLFKQPWTIAVFRKVQLDVVFKKLLTDVTYDKRLSNLPCAVYDQHLVGVGSQIVLDIRLDFTVEHNAPHIFQKDSLCVKRTFQYLLYSLLRTNQ